MTAIDNWFNGKLDYAEGVEIYRNLSHCTNMALRKLQKGKSNHNMAFLIKELRKANSVPNPPPIKEKPKEAELLPPSPTDVQIATYHHNKQLKEVSKKTVFGSIRYGELPANLRARYQEAASLFYAMCDIKFVLNDLPPEAQDDALAMQLQIEEIDHKRENIWTELHHWQNHKVELPTEPDPFEGKSEIDLYRIRQNIKTSITKLNQRLNGYYEKLNLVTDKQEVRRLERQIESSEKKLHQHRLNTIKIDELI